MVVGAYLRFHSIVPFPPNDKTKKKKQGKIKIILDYFYLISNFACPSSKI